MPAHHGPMLEHEPLRTDRLALYMREQAAERHAYDKPVAIVERWNAAFAAGRGALWSPTIRTTIAASMLWLDVHCPGCKTPARSISAPIDRHPLATVGSTVLGLRGIGVSCTSSLCVRDTISPLRQRMIN